MKNRELWKLGMLNVFAAPVRSFLTVLGMAIGIAAILAVLTLGNAGQMQVRSEMNRLGIDKVWIASNEENILCADDGKHVSDILSMDATEQVFLSEKVYAANASTEITIAGCDDDYLQRTGAIIREGRMLYPLEWENGHSALIGAKAAKKLRVSPGDSVFVENEEFVIRGVSESQSGFSQIDLDEALVVPLERMLPYTNNAVHEIMIHVPPGGNPQKSAAMFQHMLALTRGIDVDAITMQIQIDAANSVISTFVDVLNWVALICMLVGGIGVMNILLVGVRERRREIGIMQSLGMRRMQICLLFLSEAMMYAAIGGTLGVGFGIGLIDAAGRSIGLSPAVKTGECILVLCAAVATGLAFGVTPAIRASNLKPVDALRSE
ncbi:MAG: ABC transporter permease [Clostridia bacterium]|nr:ABC transporter permease [Clostridia bacterium]